MSEYNAHKCVTRTVETTPEAKIKELKISSANFTFYTICTAYQARRKFPKALSFTYQTPDTFSPSTVEKLAEKEISIFQVSSSEFFSVSFDLSDDSGSLDRDELLPAAKGTYLAEALNAACERRGIDMSRIEVFDGFSQSLPIHTTETSSLGGKYLRVTGEYAENIRRNYRGSFFHLRYRKLWNGKPRLNKM
ncbi:hypothetical protein K0M31_018597 [Melipona bicolor]|uniref:Uncharacterized protein n=1 Tax=Melipona bicolor TaxID=60889 RepID=A0AA40KRT5_9HYME|nr:hypothetical protein K0M31_018597 [Melipona bicolor]